jgi:DNA replication protein DnaC
MEQKLAVEIGIRSIDKYLQQLGPRAATQTKNLLIHGVPGSGKSYVAQYLNFYAISKGLTMLDAKFATLTLEWMDTISLQGKTDFFQKSVGEYSKSGVGVDRTDQSFAFALDASF